MIMHDIVQALFLLTGLVSLMASLFNSDWFFTTENASFIVKKLGRSGARWAYGTLGAVFIFAAVYFHYRTECL
jgi:hypothetical protein